MPAAHRRAAAMPRQGGGNILAFDAEARAPQAEIDIFEVRFETLFEQANAAKNLRAEQSGSPGRGPDGACRGEYRSIVTPRSHPPRGSATTHRIEGGVDTMRRVVLQDASGGEPCAGLGERFEIIGGQF